MVGGYSNLKADMANHNIKPVGYLCDAPKFPASPVNQDILQYSAALKARNEARANKPGM